MKPARLLFCLATTALSGGVRMVFEVASRLQARGHTVAILALSGPPRWYDLQVPLLDARDFGAIDPSRYDLVFATNAYMVPLLWPQVGPARLAFYAHDYESFHHGPASTFESFSAESPAIRAVYQLPVPIIASSRAVQQLIRKRACREVWHAPLGLNRAFFHEQPRRTPAARRRVLFVGNYLFPYKGIGDGLDALAYLAPDLDIEAVLVTQETRERRRLEPYRFPIEIHLRPPEAALPAIYASADVYCCASWYEGLGLPGIEAMACGVPVVSTRTHGVNDYGIDGTNLLLAQPHDPIGLAAALRRVLSDSTLARLLRDSGLASLHGRFEWNEGIDRFEAALADILASAWPPPPVSVLNRMLAQLEEDGCFTPIDVFRVHGRVRQELDTLCTALIDGVDEYALVRLRQIRDDLARLTRNPRAQYHHAVRAQYDFCQLVLALADDPRLPSILSARRDRTSTYAPNAAAALREIRYLE